MGSQYSTYTHRPTVDKRKSQKDTGTGKYECEPERSLQAPKTVLTSSSSSSPLYLFQLLILVSFRLSSPVP